MIDPSSTIIEVQRVAPMSWWPLASGIVGGCIAGCFSLWAVRQTNANNLKKMIEEHKFQAEKDSQSRKHEAEKYEISRMHEAEKYEKSRKNEIESEENFRKFELRQSVYLKAGKTFRRANDHLASLPTRDTGDSTTLMAPLTDAMDVVDEVMLVGSYDVQRVVADMAAEYGRLTMHLLGEHAKCSKLKADLKLHTDWHGELGDQIGKLDGAIETVDSTDRDDAERSARKLAEMDRRIKEMERVGLEISQLSDSYHEAQMGFFYTAMSELEKINNLRVDFLAATRSDLGLPFEPAWLKERLRDENEAARVKFAELNQKLKSVYDADG